VPTLLAAIGTPIPDGLDGVACARALTAPPRFETDRVPPPNVAPPRDDAAADAEIAARLAALGYVEAAR